MRMSLMAPTSAGLLRARHHLPHAGRVSLRADS
jgi:hypothetical protein